MKEFNEGMLAGLSVGIMTCIFIFIFLYLDLMIKHVKEIGEYTECVQMEIPVKEYSEYSKKELKCLEINKTYKNKE
jgi:hypothetical protein